MELGVWISSFWMYAIVVLSTQGKGNLVQKFESPVRSALRRVNVTKEKIFSNISDFFQYSYDSLDNIQIADGGSDMYDNGNKVDILTSGETTRIVYENFYNRQDYEFSSSMGWPFTALMYINNTDGARSFYSIQVTSNTGADGGGWMIFFNGSLISCGVNVTYFVTQVYNAYDPSICEVYYAFGAGEASEGFFQADNRSRNTNDLDTVISLGRNPRNAWMGYMLLSRKGGLMIGESEVRESVKLLTSAVLDCQGEYCHVNNITCLNGGTCSIQDGIYYTCKCSPGYYGQRCGRFLTLTAPRKVLSVSGDERLLISVIIVTSVRRVKLRLYRENITGNAVHNLTNIGNETVHFQLSGITRKAEGTYKILAIVDRHTAISKVEITVHERAEVKEINYPFTYTPTATGSDRIICRATGVPLPVASWYRNGLPVRSDRSGRGVFQTQTQGGNDEAAVILHVGDAEFSDNGTYVCKAANRVGPNNQLAVQEAVAELAVYGAPVISNISSIPPKSCTSNSSVEILWAPNNQTSGIKHRVTMKSQNTLMPHYVTLMTMAGRASFEDLYPFTTYQLRITVCPDKCIPKLNATRNFTTEVKLPDEVQNPMLKADGCSLSCTVTWEWTQRAGSERIIHTEVTWEQRGNGSLALEVNGRANVRWPVATYLIPTFTRSDIDFVVFLRVASCAGMGKSVVASGSCHPSGTCVNTSTVALAVVACIFATIAVLFGLLLVLKIRKQKTAINTESTAVPRATSDDSCERARYVTEDHREENLYEEFEDLSAPPEENLYENHVVMQEETL